MWVPSLPSTSWPAAAPAAAGRDAPARLFVCGPSANRLMGPVAALEPGVRGWLAYRQMGSSTPAHSAPPPWRREPKRRACHGGHVVRVQDGMGRTRAVGRRRAVAFINRPTRDEAVWG
ncbi:hypothetical protein CDD83_5335 [Cordyceps sp. RAO-2017]|nr:hypothetical protein CDD83_5335 [Cordyceps sp. RAO-2017]